MSSIFHKLMGVQAFKNAGHDHSNSSDRFYGLENCGNVCYCNSVLQALYHCRPFRECIQNFPYLTTLEDAQIAAAILAAEQSNQRNQPESSNPNHHLHFPHLEDAHLFSKGWKSKSTRETSDSKVRRLGFSSREAKKGKSVSPVASLSTADAEEEKTATTSSTIPSSSIKTEDSSNPKESPSKLKQENKDGWSAKRKQSRKTRKRSESLPLPVGLLSPESLADQQIPPVETGADGENGENASSSSSSDSKYHNSASRLVFRSLVPSLNTDRRKTETVVKPIEISAPIPFSVSQRQGVVNGKTIEMSDKTKPELVRNLVPIKKDDASKGQGDGRKPDAPISAGDRKGTASSTKQENGISDLKKVHGIKSASSSQNSEASKFTSSSRTTNPPSKISNGPESIPKPASGTSTPADPTRKLSERSSTTRDKGKAQADTSRTKLPANANPALDALNLPPTPCTNGVGERSTHSTHSSTTSSQSDIEQSNDPENLLTSLRDLFVKMSSQRKKYGIVSPSHFVSNLRRENEVFRSTMHQDAHEFFNYLLNSLAEILQKERAAQLKRRSAIARGASNVTSPMQGGHGLKWGLNAALAAVGGDKQSLGPHVGLSTSQGPRSAPPSPTGQSLNSTLARVHRIPLPSRHKNGKWVTKHHFRHRRGSSNEGSKGDGTPCLGTSHPQDAAYGLGDSISSGGLTDMNGDAGGSDNSSLALSSTGERVVFLSRSSSDGNLAKPTNDSDGVRQWEALMELRKLRQQRRAEAAARSPRTTSRQFHRRMSQHVAEHHRSRMEQEHERRSKRSGSPLESSSENQRPSLAKQTRDPSMIRTWVHELFEGELVNETRCLTCESVTNMSEKFIDLSIDLEAPNMNIGYCLENFSKAEVLTHKNKFHCDVCGSLQEAEKRMKVKRVPPVLALHLKRFKYHDRMERYVKLGYRMVFPMEIAWNHCTEDPLMENRVYELFAIVVHIGATPNHGHYITLVRSQSGGSGNSQWWLFDDDTVKKVHESELGKYFGDQISSDASMPRSWSYMQKKMTEGALEEEVPFGLDPSSFNGGGTMDTSTGTSSGYILLYQARDVPPSQSTGQPQPPEVDVPEKVRRNGSESRKKSPVVAPVAVVEAIDRTNSGDMAVEFDIPSTGESRPGSSKDGAMWPLSPDSYDWDHDEADSGSFKRRSFRSRSTRALAKLFEGNKQGKDEVPPVPSLPSSTGETLGESSVSRISIPAQKVDDYPPTSSQSHSHSSNLIPTPGFVNYWPHPDDTIYRSLTEEPTRPKIPFEDFATILADPSTISIHRTTSVTASNGSSTLGDMPVGRHLAMPNGAGMVVLNHWRQGDMESPVKEDRKRNRGKGWRSKPLKNLPMTTANNGVVLTFTPPDKSGALEGDDLPQWNHGVSIDATMTRKDDEHGAKGSSKTGSQAFGLSKPKAMLGLSLSRATTVHGSSQRTRVAGSAG